MSEGGSLSQVVHNPDKYSLLSNSTKKGQRTQYYPDRQTTFEVTNHTCHNEACDKAPSLEVVAWHLPLLHSPVPSARQSRLLPGASPLLNLFDLPFVPGRAILLLLPLSNQRRSWRIIGLIEKPHQSSHVQTKHTFPPFL